MDLLTIHKAFGEKQAGKKLRTFFLILAVSLFSWLSGQEPDTIWQRSLAEFERKNFHAVIEDMNGLLKQYPEFSNALYNRGIAKLNLGDDSGACADMQRAMELGFEINKKYIDFLCNKQVTRNMLVKEFYGKQKVIPELGYRPRYTRADSLRGMLTPDRTCFDVYYYDLHVRIIPKRKRITGENKIYFHVTHPTRRIQIDLFSQYKITDIHWEEGPLSYHREFNTIFIDFPRELQDGDQQMINIEYSGKPGIAINPPWEGGFVWNHDPHKNLWVGVACEQLGASSWWPNKDHLSDKPDSMQIRIDVPVGYTAVSNGNLRSTESAGKDYASYTWFVSYPINNYNITFYMGKYVGFADTLVTGKDTILLKYHVLPENLEKAKQHFKQTRDVLSFYCRAFGPYPFKRDGFGLVESPYEGMEHQSAIAYGNGYDNNNTNAYRNKQYDFIIVHEAAHEWWGNSVTAEDMADIWLHEGFATYAEYLFIESRFGKDDYLYELTDKSGYIFNIWPMVQHRNVNENSFISNDVYHKGAMMLHCLRSTVNNDSLFFGMIRDFCIQHRYMTITSDDFIQFVNHYSGEDYTSFFRKFLYDTRLPVLTYSYCHENDDLVIKYRWTEVESGFKMPFGIETDLAESFRIEATEKWQEIRIPGTTWFNFYNLWKGYKDAKDNSFTYYWTRCENL
jgi:aminopeptidase N